MEENTKPAKERKTNVKKENTSKKDTKKKTNAKKNDSNGNTKKVNAQKNDSNGNKKKTKVTQNSSNANKKRTNSGKKGINTKKIEKSDTTKRATRTDTRIKKIIQEQIKLPKDFLNKIIITDISLNIYLKKGNIEYSKQLSYFFTFIKSQSAL